MTSYRAPTPYSVCWDFQQRGNCPRGNACKWSHEIVQRPSDGSQFCWDFLRTGRCPRGSQCRWIHELLLLPWVSPSMIPMPTPILGGLEPYEEVPGTPEPFWDQFDENNRLFGISSTYDPSMSAYTTPLALDSLTDEQIAKADQLARIPLPSEKVRGSSCSFCDKCFDQKVDLISHFQELLFHVLLGQDGSECTGTAPMKALLKRKSWIVVQESLPSTLVSQIESLYKRQITSSTNLQVIIEAVRTSEYPDRDQLLTELTCLLMGLAGGESKELKHRKSESAALVAAA